MPDAEPLLKLRPGSVAWRQFEDEVLLLDMRTNTYLSTNPAATLLWRRLEEGSTRADLVALLVETYDIEGHVAAADLDAFLAECRRRDLLDGGAEAE